MSDCNHTVPPETLQQLLSRNRQWAEENSGLFPQASQTPPVLWIGCSDSRVPESVVTQSSPGQIFTTRTIANVVKPTLWPEHLFDEDSPSEGVDTNSDSAIFFPVAALGVHHIVVVGHTRCGGVAACVPDGRDEEGKARAFNAVKSDCSAKDPVEERLYDQLPRTMQKWLKPVRDLVDRLPSDTRVEEVIVQNVLEQVRTVARSTVVQKCWFEDGRGCLESIHGWEYDVESGELKDLGFSITKETPREEYLQVPLSA
ncbi:hypothetical protein PHLGIDRAFT_276025 [Phlebiopsis gigantea 11061_1 CR5-6]|uniref:Carbonic anhydrase n=1 Tax=Phlebiopsis gigantea (strain 11061_1 CR5-6) TaxID=745531 RepID=A0A0C3RRS3_PHLG1|nr:hypothetical protein PHLGIDRAFT_276025 [Phlebiopsis gigantea 11061_1 CR5-6]